MKRLKICISVLGIAAVSTIYLQCKSPKGYTRLPNGLEYKMLYDAPGNKKAKVGDFVRMHLKASMDDSLMSDSRKDNGGMPFDFPLQEPTFDGDFMSAVPMFSVGDSAIILLPVDKWMVEMTKKGLVTDTPDVLRNRKYMKYEFHVVDIMTPEEKEKDNKANIAAQAKKDDELLQQYFTKNNIQAKRTASGLYYRIVSEGTGETLKPGQTAEMKYIGSTLDGKVFDANMGKEAKRSEPFPVPVGAGQVIAGWDEGLQLLKKGSRAFLYLPSALAYGPKAMGEMIPANSVLIFEVEVVGTQSQTHLKK